MIDISSPISSVSSASDTLPLLVEHSTFYQCKWQPPDYAKGEDTSANYHKTLIAGFPSGDKRMIFTQMEALTGLREFSLCLVV